MFLDIYLNCGSLLAFPVAKSNMASTRTSFPPTISALQNAAMKLGVFLDYVSYLDDTSILSFTVNDWTRLIVVLTLSFRLSFPLAQCPDFDSRQARSQIKLDHFLSKITLDVNIKAPANDILSASRAVMGVMKSKYERRLDRKSVV